MLHIGRIERVFWAEPEFPAPTDAEREFLAEYMADLVRPYGFALDEAVIARGGPRYEDLVEALIARTASPVDLVVLAFAVPDARAGRTMGTYRGEAGPLAFAVCDQGTAAAFTALRLVRDLVGSGAHRRAMVLVVEQPILPYRTPPGTPLPTGVAGVALLCGEPGRARLVAHRQHAAVTEDRLDALLADFRSGTDKVVLGRALAERVSNLDGALVAPEGRPMTGVWWALADELESGRVMVADYDPTLGYLCLSTFDVPPG